MRSRIALLSCCAFATPLARAQLVARQSVTAHAKPSIVKWSATSAAASPSSAPTSGSSTLLVGGSDSCTSPDPIAGLGSFAVSTGGATTGSEGQLCVSGSQIAIHNDVWFAWTAPASGNTVISLCGGTTADSKLAVYAGSACPTAAALACNDDACGGASQVRFHATLGQSYVIQMGHFAPTGTYSGTFTIDQPAPAPDDDCASPSMLAGVGTFPIDTHGATTTVVTPFACPNSGTNAIDQDTWSEWIAPASGIARLRLCGSISGGDSKIAVYSGAGCPITLPLACNDDGCGFASQARWSVSAGQTYLLQIGSSPGAATFSGTFTLEVLTPIPNDECSAPAPLATTGPFTVDLTLASTGVEGQSEPLCFAFLSSSIDNDAWFCWTAPVSGSFDVTSVNLTPVDTKIAVYAGCGCPAGSALACNDDACGTRQSTTTFTALAGSSYTIQIGTFPGANPSLATFDIVPTPPPPAPCAYDDGLSENSVGLAGNGKLCWLQRFGTPGATTRVSDVQSEFAIAGGTPVDVLVWDDPNDDGNPTDCILVAQASGFVNGLPLQSFPLSAPVDLDGVFFAGAAVPQTVGQFPAPVDTSSCPPTAYEVAWAFGSNGTLPIDYTFLPNNDVQPTGLLSLGLPGFWVLRAGCVTSTAVPYCGNGDPQRIPCPCGNDGFDPVAGCASSINPDGARLTASGIPIFDDVVLHSRGMSGTVCVFFRTTPALPTSGVVFGDGITCATGSLLRLRAVSFPGGIANTASFPTATTITLATRSGTFPGSGARMSYGVYYRNAAAGFCTPSTFNTTNTLDVTW